MTKYEIGQTIESLEIALSFMQHVVVTDVPKEVERLLEEKLGWKIDHTQEYEKLEALKKFLQDKDICS